MTTKPTHQDGRSEFSDLPPAGSEAGAPEFSGSAQASAWESESLQDGPVAPVVGGRSENVAPRVRSGSTHSTLGGAERFVAASHRPKVALTHDQREDGRLAEAERRLAVLTAFLQEVSNGASPRRAAKALGESRVTLWRWEQRYRKEGFEGLIPATENCGRTPWLKKLGMTEDEIRQVQALHLDTGSNTTALRLFAQSDRCRPELAAAILDPTRTSKHSIPPSIRDATKVSENLKKAHRGPRKLALSGMWTPRRLDILPGDIFTSDDTTPIWAWWVPWYESEEYPFGVKVLQGQFLPVIDVASQCVLTLVLIAREKSSYRAADIWNLFGHTFDTVGLPRLGWQLERGSWDSNLVRGQDVEYQDGEISRVRRVGGLRSLPSNLTDWHTSPVGPLKDMPPEAFPKNLQTWTSYLPKSKSIEAFFNRSQTLEGTIWGALGRDQMRNPFEKTKKIYEACKRGAADPRLHFLSQEEMLLKLKGIAEYLSNEPMEGEVFRGIPKKLFQDAVEQRPLLRMPEDQRYLYRRDWKPLTITQGWARVRATDEITGKRYSLFYCNPRVFAHHEGEPVVVYYDRENYEQPAQIHLARDGSYLCDALYEDRRGSFLEGDLSGHDLRKQWKNAVMSAYATLTPHVPSKQIPAQVQARRDQARDQARRDEAAQAEQSGPPTAPRGEGQGEGSSNIPTEFSAAQPPRDRKRPAEEPRYVGDLRMQLLMEK
jgi:hypothetical protein